MAGEKSESQSVSHIHDKCHLLFGCLVFKGAPLSKLYKKFFKGISNAECFEPIPDGWIAPWFCSVSDDIDFHLKSVSDLGDKKAIALELSILNAQPSPSWGLLLKVLMMRQCWVATAMLEHLFDNPCSIGTTEKNECAGFMCNGECYLPSTDVEQALVHIIVAIGNAAEVKATLLGALESRDTLWAAHLDRNQVWNQKLPGWLEALVEPLAECLNPVVEIIERATKEGASVEQQTALSIALLCRTTDCLPPGICQCSNLLEDIIPADCHPLADSVLIQLLVTALYRRTKDTPMAESLCHLDVSLLQELNSHDLPGTRYDLESSPVICELQVSQLLLTEIGRRALKTIYKYLKEDSTWLLKALGQPVPHRNSSTLLYTMFHIGHKQFDEVLSENRVLDWQSLLSIPLGLKEHETWELINSRLPDSVDEEVSQHDNAVAMTLRRVFQNVATK
ncbi:hypothetical protein AAG570_004090 [Ranatra chinensis]|uniref:Uncharacterized protein n=1 Tax=Ranatra chinensis TaxID=642074 RepID=A0ABD0Y522_9HEMI